MMNRIARKLAVGATLIALITPSAFAKQLGTDPEPGVIHVILAFLGMA